MKKEKKKLWVAVWIVSIVLVIAALSVLCVYLYKMLSAGKDYDDLRSIASVSVPATADEPDSEPISSLESKEESEAVSEDVSSATSTEASAPSKAESSKPKTESKKTESKKTSSKKPDTINGSVNFTELWKINTDIYAWIKIPNTNVDYPILQTDGDDSFYLNHNYKKEYEFAGSIYTEKLNSKDFSDPNTLIYGHNMNNGTMFRTLNNFRDPAFFETNPYFYIYLPDRTLTYEVFSAYEYDDRHILYSFDFSNRDVFADYLEYAMNPTASMECVRRDVDVTPDDKIVTLSTCYGNIETSRFLVQGVLIKDEPAA